MINSNELSNANNVVLVLSANYYFIRKMHFFFLISHPIKWLILAYCVVSETICYFVFTVREITSKLVSVWDLLGQRLSLIRQYATFGIARWHVTKSYYEHIIYWVKTCFLCVQKLALIWYSRKENKITERLKKALE